MWVESVRKFCPIPADLEFCTGALDNGQKALNPSTGSGDRQDLSTDGEIIALVDGGVITIPVGIGTIIIVTAIAGWFTIYWEDLAGVTQELLEIAIDFSADLAEEAERIADLVINEVSTSIGIATNLLEALRGTIVDAITGVIGSIEPNLATNGVRDPKSLGTHTRRVAEHLARLLRLSEVGGVPPGEDPDPGNDNDNHWWKEILNFLQSIQRNIRGASRRQVMKALKDRGFTEQQILDIERRLAEAAEYIFGQNPPPFLP